MTTTYSVWLDEIRKRLEINEIAIALLEALPKPLDWSDTGSILYRRGCIAWLKENLSPQNEPDPQQ